MVLKLYVSGDMPRSELAVRRLKQLTDQVPERCEVEVIDVLTQPERAETDRILATPTLIKESPPPPRRIVGDLRDMETIRVILGMASS